MAHMGANAIHRRPTLCSRVLACAIAMAACSFASGLTATDGMRPPTDKPNILFILVDDLGKEWLSAYGSEEIRTPHVDRLAAGGLLFHNAYSMPQCTPSRVTLLTGQYPWRNGWCNHWDVPRWGAGCHFDWRHNITFARPLKQAGYATAAAGKWQINDFRVTPDAMRKHGFDEWCMWTGYESQNPPSAERYWDPYLNTPEGSKTYSGKFGCDVFVDFLVDFMTRHRNEPMLLYFPMALTHGPLVATPDDPDASGPLARHQAMVRYADAALGRLVTALDQLGIRNNTIVIWTTDNGSDRMSARVNGRTVKGGKAQLTESGVCAPFIVNCPGLVQAGETDALTDFTDLLPTFCDLAGASPPEGVVLDGRSFAGVILGQHPEGPREWIMALGRGPAALDTEGVHPAQRLTDRVVRDKRYKLFVLDGQPARFVDLQADPDEQTNLLDSTESRLVTARQKLEAVIANCPEEDARPRYTPTPPRPWDRQPVQGVPTGQAPVPAKGHAG